MLLSNPGLSEPDENDEISECACGLAGSVATVGHCERTEDEIGECDKRLTTCLGLMFCACFFIFMCDTTIPLAILRAVKPELKSHAMTNYWVINKLFGAIPGPLIGGALIDAACTCK